MVITLQIQQIFRLREVTYKEHVSHKQLRLNMQIICNVFLKSNYSFCEFLFALFSSAHQIYIHIEMLFHFLSKTN